MERFKVLIIREAGRWICTYSLKVHRCVSKVGVCTYTNAFYWRVPERMPYQPHRWQSRGDYAPSTLRRPVCNLFRKSLWRPQSSEKRKEKRLLGLPFVAPPVCYYYSWLVQDNSMALVPWRFPWRKWKDNLAVLYVTPAFLPSIASIGCYFNARVSQPFVATYVSSFMQIAIIICIGFDIG